MRLVSKTPTNYFWVEGFNDDDRTFFEGLGFKHVEARGPVSFGFCDTMEFIGTKVFGMWSDEECDKIFMAVRKYWGKFEVEEHYPN